MALNNFANLLYELRKEKGLTQSELGAKLGLTDKAVSRWETGESFPETAQLVPLAALFNITVDELLKGERNGNEVSKLKPTAPEFSPLSKKEAIQVATGVSLILLGAILCTIFILFNVSLLAAVIIAGICLASAIYILVVFGMNKLMVDNKLPQEIINKGNRAAQVTAAGVCSIILSLVPVLYMILERELILWAVIVGSCLLIPGVALCVLGGIGYFSDVLLKIELPMQYKISKEFNLIGVFCSCINIIATIIYLFIGFVFNIWHPSWIVFVISGLLCGIVGVVLGTKATTKNEDQKK